MAPSTYEVWDAKYNRPIVGGKVTNPTTGEVEDAGPTLVAGPPSIHAIWFNVKPREPSGWKSLGASLNCPIDKALCQIGLHVQQGLYSIVSLNASAYSLTIMCESQTPSEEFRGVIRTMRADLQETHEDEPLQVAEPLRASSSRAGVAGKTVVVKEGAGS